MSQGLRLIERSASAYAYPLLVKRLLPALPPSGGDRMIVSRGGRRFTYPEFISRVRRLASGLASLGVTPGTRVAILDWDTHRYLEAMYAVPCMGAVLHCVNVRLAPEQIRHTLAQAEDQVVMVNEDLIPLAEAVVEQSPGIRLWIVMRDCEEEHPCGVPFAAEYEEVLARGDAEWEFPEFDENAQATLFHTTGSATEPRGVLFSHRQLVLHTMGLMMALGPAAASPLLCARDVYMPLTPLFHVHGWGLPYAATLLGLKQVYPGRYDPEAILKLLVSEKVTLSHCVPTILQMLVSSPATAGLDLKGCKMVVGGAALTRGLADTALNLGIDVYSGYGLSETGPLLSLSLPGPEDADAPRDRQLDIRTTAGRPAPMVELKLLDALGVEQPFDGYSPGEIVARAPWLSQGYDQDTEKGGLLWRDGYLHTGDVAVINPQGYIRITDRIRDMIKTGGEWVSSLFLEDLISRHPGVAEVAVVGVPDDKWGERPVAMIVPAMDPGTVTAEELRAFLMQFVEEGAITRYWLPDRYEFVDELPKSSVGKLSKRVIRQRF